MGFQAPNIFNGLLRNAPGPIRSEAELQGTAVHVSYEIHMLIYAAKHVEGYYASPRCGTEVSKNMALDSFLMHYRTLRAFLCPTLQPIGNDDILASDFLKEATARDVGDVKQLSVDQDRLNKMLAHLSYKRDQFIEGGEDGWEVARMLVLILEQLDAFLAMLPPTERSWFPPLEEIAEAKAFAQSVVDSLDPH